MWFILALASSIFAALTSILAKIGIDGGQFQSCNRHSYPCCIGYVLGYGLPHQCSGRNH